MKHIHRIDFQEDAIVLRFTDDLQPKWVEEGIAFLHWREHPHAVRLARVGLSIFRLFLERPEFIETHDEVIQEWLSQVFNERTVEG